MSDILTPVLKASEEIRSGLAAITPLEEREAMTPVVELLLKHHAVPASTSKSSHGGFPGGLIVHTERVWSVLQDLAAGAMEALYDYREDVRPIVQDPAALSADITSLTPSSIFKVVIIHDLNKIQDAAGTIHYLPNILKSGSVSDAKPWVVNKESGLLQSLNRLLDSSFLKLAEEDKVSVPAWWAEALNGDGVNVRDGLLSIAVAKSVSPKLQLTQQERNAIIYHDGAYAGRTGIQDNENLLQILLHAADMIASRLLC